MLPREFQEINVMRSQVLSAQYEISILSAQETFFLKSRLINISAGHLEIYLVPADEEGTSEKNQIVIRPDDTTIRANLRLDPRVFTRVRNSFNSVRHSNIIAEAKLDTCLTLSEQGDLIIEEPVRANILDFTLTRTFT
jgi:hypothetical protein